MLRFQRMPGTAWAKTNVISAEATRVALPKVPSGRHLCHFGYRRREPAPARRGAVARGQQLAFWHAQANLGLVAGAESRLSIDER